MIDVLRTQNSIHRDRGDGLITAEIGTDLNYLTPAGVWEDVNLNFRGAADGFVIDRHRLKTRIRRQGNITTMSIVDEFGRGIEYPLARMPVVANRNAQLDEWSYTATKTGLKLTSSPITARRGPRRYEFKYNMIEPAGQTIEPLKKGELGGLESSGLLAIPRAYAVGANGISYLCEEWSIEPQDTIVFNFDDSQLPDDAFPYVLDPSSMFSTTGANDQHVLKKGSSYPPGGAVSRVTTGTQIFAERSYYSGSNEYYIVNALMKWDTSSLEDAIVVESSYINVILDTRSNTNSRSTTIDWYVFDSTDNDYSQEPIDTARAATTLGTFGLDTNNRVTLTDGDNYINRVGMTGLRWHITGGAPTGLNYLGLASQENTATEPKLEVNYRISTGIYVGMIGM